MVGDNVKKGAEKYKAAATDDYSGALPGKLLEENIAFFNGIFKKDSVLRQKKIIVHGVYNYECALLYGRNGRFRAYNRIYC